MNILGRSRRDWRDLYANGYLMRRLTAHRRALPDFIVNGTMKSGTTSFYAYLSQHPQINPAQRKAIRYFNYFRDQGDGWYRSHFPYIEPGKITGEASPLYFWGAGVPADVKRLVPDVKLITILRNPITRAFSQYHMQAKQDGEPGFDAATDPDSEHYLEPKRQYLERGHYARYIRRWLEHFPREQMLFLKFESLYGNPTEELAKVYRFLGIDVVLPDDLTPRVVGSYDRIPPATVERLAALYAQSNAELRDLLGDDFTWD
ncbi:MAG: sulfotransferase domain-containing protein [Pseudomonadota bacterium]